MSPKPRSLDEIVELPLDGALLPQEDIPTDMVEENPSEKAHHKIDEMIARLGGLQEVQNLEMRVSNLLMELGVVLKADDDADFHLSQAQVILESYINAYDPKHLDQAYCYTLLSTCLAEKAKRKESQPEGIIDYLKSLQYQYLAMVSAKGMRSKDLDVRNSDIGAIALLRRHRRGISREFARKLCDFGRFVESANDRCITQAGAKLKEVEIFKNMPELSPIVDPLIYNPANKDRLLALVYQDSYVHHAGARPSKSQDAYGWYHIARSLLGLGKAHARWVYSEEVGKLFIDLSIGILAKLKPRENLSFRKAIDRKLGEAYLARAELSTEDVMHEYEQSIQFLEKGMPPGTLSVRDEREARDAHMLLAKAHLDIASYLRSSKQIEFSSLLPSTSPDNRFSRADAEYAEAYKQIDYAKSYPGRALDKCVLEQIILYGCAELRMDELSAFKKQIIWLKGTIDTYQKEPLVWKRDVLLSWLSENMKTPLCDERWAPLVDTLNAAVEGPVDDLYSKVIGCLRRVFPKNHIYCMVDQVKQAVDGVVKAYEGAQLIDPDDPRSLRRLIDTARLVKGGFPLEHPITTQLEGLERKLVHLVQNAGMLKEIAWVTTGKGGIFDNEFYVKKAPLHAVKIIEDVKRISDSDDRFSSVGVPEIYLWDPQSKTLFQRMAGKDLSTVFEQQQDLRKALFLINSVSGREYERYLKVFMARKQSVASTLGPWVKQWVLIEKMYWDIVPKLCDTTGIRNIRGRDEYCVRAEDSINWIPFVFDDYSMEVGKERLKALYKEHIAPKLESMMRAFVSDRNATNCALHVPRNKGGSLRYINLDFESIKFTHYIEDFVSLTLHEGVPFDMKELISLCHGGVFHWNTINPDRALQTNRFIHDFIYAGVDKMLHMMKYKQRHLDVEIKEWARTPDERYSLEVRTLRFREEYLVKLKSIIRYGQNSDCLSDEEREGLKQIGGLLLNAMVEPPPFTKVDYYAQKTGRR